MAGKYHFTNYKGFMADLDNFEQRLNGIELSETLKGLNLAAGIEGDADLTVQHRVDKIKELINRIKTAEEPSAEQMDSMWTELCECVESCILTLPPDNLNTAQGRSLWSFSNAMRTLISSLNIMQNQQWRAQAEGAVEEIKQAKEAFSAAVDEAAKDINPSQYPDSDVFNRKVNEIGKEFEDVTAEYSQKYGALDQGLKAAEEELKKFNELYASLDKMDEEASKELESAEKEFTLHGDFVGKLEAEYARANAEFSESMRKNVAAADEELAKFAKALDEAEKLVNDTESSIAADRKFIEDFEKEMKDLDNSELPEYMANVTISPEERLLYLKKINLQNLRAEDIINNMPGEITGTLTVKPDGETVTLEKAEEMIAQAHAMQRLQPSLLEQYRTNGNEYTRSCLQMYDRFLNFKEQLSLICKDSAVLNVLSSDVEKASSIKALVNCAENAGALIKTAMDNSLTTITPEMKESLINLQNNFRSLQNVKDRLHKSESNIDSYKEKAASAKTAYDQASEVHEITLKDLSNMESPTSKLNQAKTDKEEALKKLEEQRKRVQAIKDLKEKRVKLAADVKNLKDEKDQLESKMAEAKQKKSEMDRLSEKLDSVKEAYTGVAAKSEDLQNQLGLDGKINPMLGMEGLQPIFDNLKFYSDTSEVAKESGHKNTPEFNDMVDSVRAALGLQEGGEPLTNDQLIEKLEHVAERSQNYLNEKQKGVHLFTYTMRETRLAYAKELKNFAETAIKSIKANVKAAEDVLKAGKEASDDFYKGNDPYFIAVDHIKDNIAPAAKEKYFNADGTKKAASAEEKAEPVILDGYTTMEAVLNLGNYNAVTKHEMEAFNSFRNVMTELAESSTGMKYFLIALGQPRDGHASALSRMYEDYKNRYDKYDSLESEESLRGMIKNISYKKDEVKGVETEQKSVQIEENLIKN